MPHKVLIAGDTHGNIRWWEKILVPAALKNGCEEIWQVGDFGYWEHTGAGVKYLHKLSDLLCDADLKVYWIDGNHENHTWLQQVYILTGAQRIQPKRIRENVWHLPRGCVIERHGRKIMACGGAYSIDKPRRKAGETWWPEEVVMDKDVKTCMSQGKVDILLTHDCPGTHTIGEHAYDKSLHAATMANRDKLTEVTKNARPQLVFHGHWHVYYEQDVLNTHIVGLANDGEYQSYAVLDLDTMKHTVPDAPPERGPLPVIDDAF